MISWLLMVYAGLLQWNNYNKCATGSGVWQILKRVCLEKQITQKHWLCLSASLWFHTLFFGLWGPTVGKSLRLTSIQSRKHTSTVAVHGDENENSVVEGRSKKAARPSQRSSRHIEQLRRAGLFSAAHPAVTAKGHVRVQVIFPVCQSRMDQSMTQSEVPQAGKDTELHCALLPFSHTYFGCRTTHLQPLLKQWIIPPVGCSHSD